MSVRKFVGFCVPLPPFQSQTHSSSALFCPPSPSLFLSKPPSAMIVVNSQPAVPSARKAVSPPPTDSGVQSLVSSAVDVSAAPSEKKFGFAEIVNKRLRTLKKRLAKIEKYETTEVSSLNADQLEAVKSKPVVSSLIAELTELSNSLTSLEVDELKQLKRQQKQFHLEKQASIAKSVSEAVKNSANLTKFMLKLLSSLDTLIKNQSDDLNENTLDLLHNVKSLLLPSVSPSDLDDMSVAELDQGLNFAKKVLNKDENAVSEFESDSLTYADIFNRINDLTTPAPQTEDTLPEEDTTQSAAEAEPSTESFAEQVAQIEQPSANQVSEDMSEQLQSQGGRVSFLTGEEFINAMQQSQVPPYPTEYGAAANMVYPHSAPYQQPASIPVSFIPPPSIPSTVEATTSAPIEPTPEMVQAMHDVKAMTQIANQNLVMSQLAAAVPMNEQLEEEEAEEQVNIPAPADAELDQPSDEQEIKEPGLVSTVSEASSTPAEPSGQAKRGRGRGGYRGYRGGGYYRGRGRGGYYGYNPNYHRGAQQGQDGEGAAPSGSGYRGRRGRGGFRGKPRGGDKDRKEKEVTKET
ncbi:hypothetical protein BKA69DRAFT_1172438 [Paraphysoderma sedebokerense]|nr:hypothetical protein BKA69DRAFT_1172438 [Paraphysoderma sedebokerense]